MCFKRKNVPELRAKDRELIDGMDKIFDVILSAVGDSEVVNSIKTTQGSVHYLVPSANKKVLALDEKLKNQIDDLRAEVVKGKYDSEKIAEALREINVSVSTRNSRA